MLSLQKILSRFTDEEFCELFKPINNGQHRLLRISLLEIERFFFIEFQCEFRDYAFYTYYYHFNVDDRSLNMAFTDYEDCVLCWDDRWKWIGKQIERGCSNDSVLNIKYLDDVQVKHSNAITRRNVMELLKTPFIQMNSRIGDFIVVIVMDH
ncbi:hypothetical protein FDP41_013155 [Naegleria fowleri]|uniref:Uncharacterized protein n=1 Tax=Naegleria fowleri TaxID=5763 RepID=A0A6A5C1M8_NAEFO|nr:uncharacterized protein FDP41_013155 [Naegleria fowleri]KAF0980672.1 hypothetical protein FDP41_013155 [Naegleria fowleri]CAG4708909.1 unnamed protein product [Naegleria fowleri]